ncbi:hypothetical protein [Curtobacterium herbarum]|uniref:Uncharacterized protein n=1 Tax=Curtobacterium herbarum TaxID=150122 RepID=A0ABN1Z9S1_9MICO|nr:hypothetical protein [Curtobacterium herbarum]MBM7476257.1 hypothetical protein [Curtobacterium herbarum]MCS6544176.1 hypothetical protein [Curtobacterium herbarum]
MGERRTAAERSDQADELPTVFRAVAETRPPQWLRRPKRAIRYEARWPGGHVETDVHLVTLMYRRAPADYSVVTRVMDEHCPETGIGPWVLYPTGDLL